MLPSVTAELERLGLTKQEDGGLCVFVPEFSFPLIIRKRDGSVQCNYIPPGDLFGFRVDKSLTNNCYLVLVCLKAASPTTPLTWLRFVTVRWYDNNNQKWPAVLIICFVLFCLFLKFDGFSKGGKPRLASLRY